MRVLRRALVAALTAASTIMVAYAISASAPRPHPSSRPTPQSGPAAIEIFSPSWWPADTTLQQIIIADRVAIRVDGSIKLAGCFHPTPATLDFLVKVARAMERAYAQDHPPACSQWTFDDAMKKWQYDFDDVELLGALTPCR